MLLSNEARVTAHNTYKKDEVKVYMAIKAKSLTDIYALFKPMALTGEQYEYYQKTAAARDGAAYEFHVGLFNRIKKSNAPDRLLVVGHGGCGKSTELHMLIRDLDAEKYPVIHIIAQDDLDPYSFSYVDIFMLIVERMIQFSEKSKLKIDKKIISAFQRALSVKVTEEFWNKDAETGVEGSITASASIPFFLNVIARITSSLRITAGFNEQLRQEIKPRIHDIILSLNALNDNLSKQMDHRIVIIIDGLEKCRQECVQKLFIEDIAVFSGVRADLVISCPIAVYRSEHSSMLAGYFSSPVVMPMISTHDKDGCAVEGGVSVIRELILKRAEPYLFEDGVLEMIISKAGGSLRDTCYILSNSAFEADMRNRKTIDIDSVDFVLRNFASDVFFRIDSKLYPRVKKIYDGDREARQDVELSKLLYSGAVFEYNGNRWVDLHPLVREYIKDHPGVLKW